MRTTAADLQADHPVSGGTSFVLLEDGTRLDGVSVGAPGHAVGEVVFNTAMTGYQEIVTDPSYARQIVTLTYPHVGNTGCNAADDESAHFTPEAALGGDNDRIGCAGAPAGR